MLGNFQKSKRVREICEVQLDTAAASFLIPGYGRCASCPLSPLANANSLYAVARGGPSMREGGAWQHSHDLK